MTELSASLDIVSPCLDWIIPPEWGGSVTEHAPLNFREGDGYGDAEHDRRVMAHMCDPFCTFWHKYTINRIKVKHGKKKPPCAPIFCVFDDLIP
jgi:hypothetical protein